MPSAKGLLASERAVGRLTHPQLVYDKSGRLQCTVCDLNIPAEKLWEPHLRSANHRKNVAAREEGVNVNKKRKIDHEGDASNGQKRKLEDERDQSERPQPVLAPSVASRSTKRVKSVRFEDQPSVRVHPVPPLPIHSRVEEQEGTEGIGEFDSAPVSQTPARQQDSRSPETPVSLTEPVDEDEWAAFERELGPLTTDMATSTTTHPPNHDRYSHATISAPAVSASQAQKEASNAGPTAGDASTKRRDYEAEAQADREEEQARRAEEFEVMEEMEERVRRLKEMRERLRGKAGVPPPGQQASGPTTKPAVAARADGDHDDDDDDDESDEIDHWFS